MTSTLTPIAPRPVVGKTSTQYECQSEGCAEFPWMTEADALACPHGQVFGPRGVVIANPKAGTVIETRERFTTVANGFGGTTTVPTPAVVRPTEKQTAFLRSLLAERAGIDLAEAIRTGLNAAREAGTLDRKSASIAIDALLKIEKAVAPKAETETPAPAAWDPSKGSMDRAVLEAIPVGRYFVDGTFLKVDRPDKGRWAGFIFVKMIRNIQGSFEDVRRVAILNPEATAARVDEGHRLAVETLASDPKAAAIAFGHKTGSCCICGRTLTDPESVKAGIGPICAAKF